MTLELDDAKDSIKLKISQETEIVVSETKEKQRRDWEAKQQLQNDCLVPSAQPEKWILEAQRNWDIFYKNNQTNFFKDRHWLDREFKVLQSPNADSMHRSLLEVGCGVGNLVFPVAQAHPDINPIYCCDFSPRAIQMVKENKLYDQDRIQAFQADLTVPDIFCETLLKDTKVDLVTSIFCISAIPPEKLKVALLNISSVLKPGGHFIIRDYAEGDGAQLRFKGQNVMNLDQNFYVRHDLTFSVFFRPDQLRDACLDVGLECLECGVVEKQVVNRKAALTMSRIFVQGVFRKSN